jgi:hypothetical protein
MFDFVLQIVVVPFSGIAGSWQEWTFMIFFLV